MFNSNEFNVILLMSLDVIDDYIHLPVHDRYRDDIVTRKVRMQDDEIHPAYPDSIVLLHHVSIKILLETIMNI